VFETLAHKILAQASAKVRVFELTAMALTEANIDVRPSDQIVRFDSEEECRSVHGGDWQKRLAQSRVTMGY
jgi:hypothetical protein